MRYVTSLPEILADLAANNQIDRKMLEEIFSEIDTGFPVIFVATLPLWTHKTGMVGITIRKKVYLLHRVRRYSAERLLELLRHEAQHVHQQQTDTLFYLHYGYHWLRSFIKNIFLARQNRQYPEQGIFYNAYRGITEESEAYAAGNQAYSVLAKT